MTFVLVCCFPCVFFHLYYLNIFLTLPYFRGELVNIFLHILIYSNFFKNLFSKVIKILLTLFHVGLVDQLGFCQENNPHRLLQARKFNIGNRLVTRVLGDMKSKELLLRAGILE